MADYSAHQLNDDQLQLLQGMLETIRDRSPFYNKKFEQSSLSIESYEDFKNIPFTEKSDLRDAYPLGLMACDEEDIVRIHSSSGTTGTPVVIPYTQKDIDDWSMLFARCYEITGVSKNDRVHITPGYGLWTAGIGFQLGAEYLGAMTIPMGPGNTEKQLQMMQDFKSTVLTSTSSYALLLAEEIEKRGLKEKIHLKKGLIGSERWSAKMRKSIEDSLGADLYDIYGLTEIYGPGIAISCDENNGMHYFSDYLFFEIINPKTGEVLPFGETGELVITTLRKEGAPLIRYRTHDLTKFLPEECPCGCPYPRIDTLVGRTDDMVKVKGVNMFPAQIEEILQRVDHVLSEYQMMIDHLNGRDIVTVYFETDAEEGAHRNEVENRVRKIFKELIGITIIPKGVDLCDLPRSEKKSTRIFDNRY